MGLFNRLKRGWTLQGIARPWPAGTSVFQHLAAHTKGGELDATGRALPGATPSDDAIEWAPGARDGILAHHGAADENDEEKAAMVRALLDVFRAPTAHHLAALYTRCQSGQLAGYADDLVDILNDTPDLEAVRVHELGKVLATEAPHLEAVKLGITLLGMVENDDRDVLEQLALHDELTMFAVTSIVKQLDDFEATVLSVAKRVHGWGRIHAVERLADTKSPAVKAWLLREGFRNDVMDEYLAHTCATAGELHRALRTPDDALLRGAAGIFRALAAGGPGLDLAHYEQRDAALAAWLPLVRPTLAELAALDALAPREELGSELRARVEALRTSDAARAAIDLGLQSESSDEFALADAAAQQRDIPTFALHEQRLLRKDETTIAVFRMLEQATPDTIERALVAAASVAEIGEPAERSHRLAFVLAALPRFAPATGEPFVLAGLRSEVTALRAAATQVVAAWGARSSAALHEALEHAAEHERDEELEAAMRRVLAGGTLEATKPTLH